MPASISISKQLRSRFLLATALGLAFFLLQLDPLFAADGHKAPPQDRSLPVEEEDFSDTPFTEYGEFNEESDEAAETKFFQYGRFFGVSLGVGYHNATGNRALLWQGGFPVFDFKVHYWFDFNLALDLAMHTANQYYVVNSSNTEVNMLRFGLDLKYYFDTKNLSAPVSFANPYVLLGAGSFTKTETTSTGDSTPDSSFGISFGAGLEFVVSPRKTFFAIEGKFHSVTFKDTHLATYRSQGIPDLTGLFYTLTGNFLFTW